MAKLEIKLIKSANGTLKMHKQNAEALGLNKIGVVKVHPDTAATRGKIQKIAHMVSVKEIAD